MSRKRIQIDIETYSDVDLVNCGVYRYVEGDFHILLFAYAFDDDEVQCVDLACGGQLPQEVVDAIHDKSIIKAAWNAQFERICLSKYFGEHADTLKSYIFAHDLTGRIMNDNSWLVRDNKLMDVAKQARNDLNKVFDMNPAFGAGDTEKNKDMATDIVANTFLKEDAPQANAGEINHDMYKLFLPFLSDAEC